MPKPKVLTSKDFSKDELKSMKVIEGQPLSPEDVARDEAIINLGREIVALVKEGKFALSQSVVLDETLFVCTNSGYYVLAPEGEIEVSDVADLPAKRKPYEGLIDNLTALKETLSNWKEEALASS